MSSGQVRPVLPWLGSTAELVVKSGYIYVPLLLDPAVEQELAAAPGEGDRPVTVLDGKYFVKAAALRSLVDNYAALHPHSFQRLRDAWLKRHGYDPNLRESSAAEGKLKIILFQVMPYFIRRFRGLKRERRDEEAIARLIEEKMHVPRSYYSRAAAFLQQSNVKRMLDRLRGQETELEPLADGPVSASLLQNWFQRALEAKIAAEEKAHLEQALRERQQFGESQEGVIAILLYIADQGSFEMDGFGVFRIDGSGEYCLYRHTGEYALKDYYGRLYLFPDCRVAVTTSDLTPVVMERYKHPFLHRYESWQPICLRHFERPRVFSADNAIKSLEEGINALFYGYRSRRRNGYHSLDRITMHHRPVDFDDYRISNAHPKIVSGEVETKNDFI